LRLGYFRSLLFCFVWYNVELAVVDVLEVAGPLQYVSLLLPSANYIHHWLCYLISSCPPAECDVSLVTRRDLNIFTHISLPSSYLFQFPSLQDQVSLSYSPLSELLEEPVFQSLLYSLDFSV
jgi:hypothetical protein